MSRHPNLRRRGNSGIYYARIYVPLDLQPLFAGKDEISKSLRTTDYAEAKRLVTAVLDEWSATFSDMRRRLTLTDDDIQTAVWDHYQAGLAAADAERLSRPTVEQIEAATDAAIAERKWGDVIGGINAMTDVEILAGRASWAARRRDARIIRLRADLSSGDTRLIEPDANAFLDKHSFHIQRGDPRYRELCQKLMRAEIERLLRDAERDAGNFSGQPQDPLIVEPAVRSDRDTTTPVTETLMGLFDKYARTKTTQGDTIRQARRDVQNFVDFMGLGGRPSKITKALVGDWHDMLFDYPVKATETAAFKGMSPQEIVAANKALSTPKPTLARQTVRRYMGSLNGFCRWLAKREVISVNPVSDMMPEKGDPKNPRDTFKDDALKTLFSSPLFVGAKGDQWRDLNKPGDIRVRDHRFWIPWVMLYSGARPAEVAQLFVADIRQADGVWIMDVTDDEGKRTKTAGSRRVVPIHSALIAQGFLEHVDRRRSEGAAQVFPEIEILPDGQIAAQFSREFNRYLTDVGVKVDKSIVAYSLRHTFVDRARRAGYFNEDIAIVVGHETGNSKKTITSGYGVEQHGTIEWRQRLVEAVQYPSLT